MSEIHDYKFEFVFHGCDMVAACSVMEWLVSEADNGQNNLGGGFHVDDIENGRGKAALRRDSYDMPKSA